MMIDSHCHLSKNDYSNLEEVIKHMQNNIMVISSATLDDLDEIINLIENNSNIYATIGIHPEYANTYTQKHLDNIEKKLSHPKVVGIGEIGLDYHYTKENKEKQQQLFIKQIKLANKYHKPIVIHTRDAIEDTYNIIKKYKETNLKCDFHCYSGSLEMAKRLIPLNAVFGIGGVLTFKNEKKLKEIVRQLDLKYFVLETDSPYLTPEPFRGKQNEPYNVVFVAENIAELKTITLEEVKEQKTKNALNL
ncbi:MAG: TatD family hydrolase, partial [Bacilli bacterium]|nr:TatD family hydrolase [Bacilli bacterium]